MNEHQPTLKEISSTAEQNYQDHLSNEKKAESAKAEITHNSLNFNDAPWYAADQRRLSRNAVRSKEASETAVRAGAEHYRDNEAAYHDLAVIDAHLAGIAINTSEPIVVGVKTSAEEIKK